jgi:23S rRNA (guanosine2251-2'-O)-methyltransferase
MAQLIYGKNTVYDAINSDTKIHNVYVSNPNDKICVKLKEKNIRFKVMDKRSMDRKVDGNHQGIIAEIDDFNYINVDELIAHEKENETIVILDQIEDPHNFGAIIRTCDAAGVDKIIIQDRRQVQVTPTVTKVATGATNHMKIARVNNIVNAIKKLKDNGY